MLEMSSVFVSCCLACGWVNDSGKRIKDLRPDQPNPKHHASNSLCKMVELKGAEKPTHPEQSDAEARLEELGQRIN